MTLQQQALTYLILNNPRIHLAYFDPRLGPGQIVAHTSHSTTSSLDKLPPLLPQNRIHVRHAPPLRTLELPVTDLGPHNDYQDCQDEPIKLGTQIQPKGAGWVGTAGSPVSWMDSAGDNHYGILSNWHVFCSGRFPLNHPMHQPEDSRPACSFLSLWNDVHPDTENTCDAAVADALVGDFHSISWSLLELGTLNPEVSPATVSTTYVKVGRTTGLTSARCEATNVTVRVGYGDFQALFVGQDLFVDIDQPFSAPGDSGSLIVCTCNNGPSSLLFAGGGNQTIGNPIPAVQACLPIRFST